MLDPKHRISIEYCVPWNYLDKAVGLAAEIAGAWAPILVDLSLRGGTKGRFEVMVDDRLVFSKVKLGRFPHKGEILKLVEPLVGPPLDWR